MTTRTKSNFFTPEDFEFVGVVIFGDGHDDERRKLSIGSYAQVCIATKANAIFSKYIEEEGRVVFGKKGESDDVKRLWWCDFKAIDDTHKAILLFIEELKHDKSEGEG